MEPRVRVAGVLRKGDSLLLIRHRKAENTYWLLPGGGVDYGETMEDSLKREFLEECNLEVEVKELLFISQGIAPDKSRHIIQAVFLVDYISGNMNVGDEEILREARYIKLEELKDTTLYPNIKGELVDYFGGDKGIKYLGHRWE